jgi:glutaredoxin 3
VAKVEIYTTMFCPYCYRAKRLLDIKGVDYREIDVTSSPELRAEMRQRSNGGQTVPQIFIDGEPIGGSDELVALNETGELDRKLERAA